jgi:hypothetical protein
VQGISPRGGFANFSFESSLSTPSNSKFADTHFYLRIREQNGSLIGFFLKSRFDILPFTAFSFVGHGTVHGDGMDAQGRHQPQIQPCRYKVGKTLGAGSYSVVKECVHIDTGRYYAAKVINRRLMAGREHMVRVSFRVST